MSNKNKRTRKTVRKGTAKGKGFVLSELARVNSNQQELNSYTEDNIFFDLTNTEVQVVSYIDY